MYIPHYNEISEYSVGRELRRKVQRYANKNKISWVEAYNKMFNTNYKPWQEILDTSIKTRNNPKSFM